MARGADAGGTKLIAQNRKARHEYLIEDTVEAGLMLVGTEVKSCREGKVSLTDAYAAVRDGEAWLLQCHINPYSHGNRQNHDPLRPRKLLLHRSEIARLIGKTRESGATLVPLALYFKDGKAKVEIALARGKKSYDKRASLMEKQANRETQRALSRRTSGKDRM